MNNARIKMEDYERYTIYLPVHCLFGRNRQKFLFAELEKRHPGFGEQCSFDTRVERRGRRWLAKVTVMNKLDIARYRAQRPHGRLLLPGKSVRAVFSSKSIIFRGLEFVLAVLVITAGAAAVFAGVLQAHVPAADAADQKLPENGRISPSAAAFFAPAAELLTAVTSAGGSIIRFSADGTAGSEQFSLTAEGCYPEAAVSAAACGTSFSEVNYHSGKPSFTAKTAGTELPALCAVSPDVIPQVRSAVLYSGAMMLTENAAAGSFAADVPRAVWGLFISRIEELCRNSGCFPFRLNIDTGGTAVRFSSEFAGMTGIEPDTEVFFSALKSAVPMTAAGVLRSDPVPDSSLLSEQRDGTSVKVGSIKKEGGEKVTYYRRQNGCISEKCSE